MTQYLLTFLCLASVCIVSIGCGHTNYCSKLKQPECANPPQQLCGCFEVETMGGGFVGGVHDPHDSGVYTEIILRPDSTIEYYQRDTLLWRGTLTMMPKRFKTIELKAVGYGYGVWSITLDDIDHIGLGAVGVMDGIGFGFVRR